MAPVRRNQRRLARPDPCFAGCTVALTRAALRCEGDLRPVWLVTGEYRVNILLLAGGDGTGLCSVMFWPNTTGRHQRG